MNRSFIGDRDHKAADICEYLQEWADSIMIGLAFQLEITHTVTSISCLLENGVTVGLWCSEFSSEEDLTSTFCKRELQDCIRKLVPYLEEEKIDGDAHRQADSTGS